MKIIVSPYTGWIILGIVLLLLGHALFLGSLYGATHWGILQSLAGAEAGLGGVLKIPEIAGAVGAHELAPGMLDRINAELLEARATGRLLLGIFSSYYYLSYAAVAFSLLSPFLKPRRLALVTIPLGVFAFWNTLWTM